MKKIIVIALLAFTHHANAQLIKSIFAGGIASGVASTSFTDSKQPFELGQNLLANITFTTTRTFHNVFYGFGNNSLNSLNGYFLPKNWDTYVVFSKSLSTSGKYLGAGIEKMEKIGNIKFFEFCEVGTGFTGSTSLTFGILMNVSWKVK